VVHNLYGNGHLSSRHEQHSYLHRGEKGIFPVYSRGLDQAHFFNSFPSKNIFPNNSSILDQFSLPFNLYKGVLLILINNSIKQYTDMSSLAFFQSSRSCPIDKCSLKSSAPTFCSKLSPLAKFVLQRRDEENHHTSSIPFLSIADDISVISSHEDMTSNNFDGSLASTHRKLYDGLLLFLGLSF
jgi:hypothetical protein